MRFNKICIYSTNFLAPLLHHLQNLRWPPHFLHAKRQVRHLLPEGRIKPIKNSLTDFLNLGKTNLFPSIQRTEDSLNVIKINTIFLMQPSVIILLCLPLQVLIEVFVIQISCTSSQFNAIIVHMLQFLFEFIL
jgi:hypothetical protein